MEYKIRDLLNKYYVPGRCGCLLDKGPESIKDAELMESTIAAFLQVSVAVVKPAAGTAAILTEHGF
jgi:hypothetical protein